MTAEDALKLYLIAKENAVAYATLHSKAFLENTLTRIAGQASEGALRTFLDVKKHPLNGDALTKAQRHAVKKLLVGQLIALGFRYDDGDDVVYWTTPEEQGFKAFSKIMSRPKPKGI